ncbi:hypothetical protein BJ508DRAFT_302276 [Ascobolus immersus RN42]|uniref:Uncharacterized protein n=1 Tax=Ascobolus immersus RN42 TaxID=1160509 RepID=A0A3N4IJ65_ASCIM|nr:hypothetical protein BJ508DRAFT_302276 [Ascobolus immersus RN42]
MAGSPPIECIIRFVRKPIHSMSRPDENLKNRIYYAQMLNTLFYILPIPPGTSHTFDRLSERGKFDDEAGNFYPIKFFTYAMEADLEEMTGLIEEGFPANINCPLFDVNELWIPSEFEQQMCELEESILNNDNN